MSRTTRKNVASCSQSENLKSSRSRKKLKQKKIQTHRKIRRLNNINNDLMYYKPSNMHEYVKNHQSYMCKKSNIYSYIGKNKDVYLNFTNEYKKYWTKKNNLYNIRQIYKNSHKNNLKNQMKFFKKNEYKNDFDCFVLNISLKQIERRNKLNRFEGYNKERMFKEIKF